jgi:hypothetical protein
MTVSDPSSDGDKHPVTNSSKRASAAALVAEFTRQYELDREEDRRREGPRIRRERLTIAGLFLSAVIAAFQWSEMRRTDHHIAEQARIAAEQLVEIKAGAAQTEQIIQANKRLTEATKLVAEAALRAQRPYMSYEMKLTRLDSDNGSVPREMRVEVIFKNHGNMPATYVLTEIGRQVSETFPEGCPVGQAFETLPPNHLLLKEEPVSIQPEGFTIRLDQDDRDAIQGGIKSLWVFGNFTFRNYVDEDSAPYRFGRRYIFVPKAGESVGFTNEGVPKNCITR